MSRGVRTRLSFKKSREAVVSEIVGSVKDIVSKFPAELVRNIEAHTNDQVQPEETELPDVEGWKVFVTDPEQVEAAEKFKVMRKIQAEYPEIFSNLIRRERK